MPAKVISIAGNRPNKVTHSVVDTILITSKVLKSWENPPSQRQLKINTKVRALAERIAQDKGVMPGHITLAVVNHVTYLVDGQHRREAWLLSGCEDGAADITTYYIDSLGELGRLFVELNTPLVRMKPDDILRGMEGCTPMLQHLRKQCPWVGYDQIRRNDRAPMLSAATLLRAWIGSGSEVPVSSVATTIDMLDMLTEDDTQRLIEFTNTLYQAWGRDPEYYRLWNSLNLAITGWMYRRTVLAQYSPNSIRISGELFGKCAMSLSATADYMDWLHGRMFNERDRSPCYNRMKAIFAKRIEEENGRKPRLPQPAWAPGH